MNTTAVNFNHSAGSLDPEAEKQARYLKEVVQRTKEALEQKIMAYSKRADGMVTSIGTQLRGVGRKRDNAAFAFFGSDSLLTLSLVDGIGHNVAQTLENMKALLKITTAAVTPRATIAPTPINLTTAFSVQVKQELVDESLALKFKEHVDAEKTSSKLAAKSIAKDEFVGPLRPEMQTLRFEFSDGVLSKDEFVNKATDTLLKYNGIIFSADETDRFALSRSKFETLRNEFGTMQCDNSYSGNVAIFVFNNAVSYRNAAYTMRDDVVKLPVIPAVKPPSGFTLAA